MQTRARWRVDGVRVVHVRRTRHDTPQTPGMNRAAAITHARAGAEKLWAGTVVIHPMAKTGAHHHGPVETRLFTSSADAPGCGGANGSNSWRRLGPAISSTCARRVLHQEINAAATMQPLSCVVVCSGQEPVVVNLDLPNVEPNPEPVQRVDDLHPSRKA